MNFVVGPALLAKDRCLLGRFKVELVEAWAMRVTACLADATVGAEGIGEEDGVARLRDCDAWSDCFDVSGA